jgi:hypothetical protein
LSAAKTLQPASSLRTSNLMATESTCIISGFEKSAVDVGIGDAAHSASACPRNDGVDGLGLVGIRRRGVPLAEHLGKLISRIESTTIPVGSLDITFFIATTSRPLAEACSAQVRYRL